MKNKSPETYADIKKVHRVLGHIKEEGMKRIYRSKNALTNKIGKFIKKV